MLFGVFSAASVVVESALLGPAAPVNARVTARLLQ